MSQVMHKKGINPFDVVLVFSLITGVILTSLFVSYRRPSSQLPEEVISSLYDRYNEINNNIFNRYNLMVQNNKLGMLSWEIILNVRNADGSFNISRLQNKNVYYDSILGKMYVINGLSRDHLIDNLIDFLRERGVLINKKEIEYDPKSDILKFNKPIDLNLLLSNKLPKNKYVVKNLERIPSSCNDLFKNYNDKITFETEEFDKTFIATYLTYLASDVYCVPLCDIGFYNFKIGNYDCDNSQFFDRAGLVRSKINDENKYLEELILVLKNLFEQVDKLSFDGESKLILIAYFLKYHQDPQFSEKVKSGKLINVNEKTKTLTQFIENICLEKDNKENCNIKLQKAKEDFEKFKSEFGLNVVNVVLEKEMSSGQYNSNVESTILFKPFPLDEVNKIYKNFSEKVKDIDYTHILDAEKRTKQNINQIKLKIDLSNVIKEINEKSLWEITQKVDDSYFDNFFIYSYAYFLYYNILNNNDCDIYFDNVNIFKTVGSESYSFNFQMTYDLKSPSTTGGHVPTNKIIEKIIFIKNDNTILSLNLGEISKEKNVYLVLEYMDNKNKRPLCDLTPYYAIPFTFETELISYKISLSSDGNWVLTPNKYDFVFIVQDKNTKIKQPSVDYPEPSENHPNLPRDPIPPSPLPENSPPTSPSEKDPKFIEREGDFSQLPFLDYCFDARSISELDAIGIFLMKKDDPFCLQLLDSILNDKNWNFLCILHQEEHEFSFMFTKEYLDMYDINKVFERNPQLQKSVVSLNQVFVPYETLSKYNFLESIISKSIKKIFMEDYKLIGLIYANSIDCGGYLLRSNRVLWDTYDPNYRYRFYLLLLLNEKLKKTIVLDKRYDHADDERLSISALGKLNENLNTVPENILTSFQERKERCWWPNNKLVLKENKIYVSGTYVTYIHSCLKENDLFDKEIDCKEIKNLEGDCISISEQFCEFFKNLKNNNPFFYESFKNDPYKQLDEIGTLLNLVRENGDGGVNVPNRFSIYLKYELKDVYLKPHSVPFRLIFGMNNLSFMKDIQNVTLKLYLDPNSNIFKYFKDRNINLEHHLFMKEVNVTLKPEIKDGQLIYKISNVNLEAFIDVIFSTVEDPDNFYINLLSIYSNDESQLIEDIKKSLILLLVRGKDESIFTEEIDCINGKSSTIWDSSKITTYTSSSTTPSTEVKDSQKILSFSVDRDFVNFGESVTLMWNVKKTEGNSLVLTCSFEKSEEPEVSKTFTDSTNSFTFTPKNLGKYVCELILKDKKGVEIHSLTDSFEVSILKTEAFTINKGDGIFVVPRHIEAGEKVSLSYNAKEIFSQFDGNVHDAVLIINEGGEVKKKELSSMTGTLEFVLNNKAEFELLILNKDSSKIVESSKKIPVCVYPKIDITVIRVDNKFNVSFKLENGIIRDLKKIRLGVQEFIFSEMKESKYENYFIVLDPKDNEYIYFEFKDPQCKYYNKKVKYEGKELKLEDIVIKVFNPVIELEECKEGATKISQSYEVSLRDRNEDINQYINLLSLSTDQGKIIFPEVVLSSIEENQPYYFDKEIYYTRSLKKVANTVNININDYLVENCPTDKGVIVKNYVSIKDYLGNYYNVPVEFVLKKKNAALNCYAKLESVSSELDLSSTNELKVNFDYGACSKVLLYLNNNPIDVTGKKVHTFEIINTGRYDLKLKCENSFLGFSCEDAKSVNVKRTNTETCSFSIILDSNQFKVGETTVLKVVANNAEKWNLTIITPKGVKVNQQYINRRESINLKFDEAGTYKLELNCYINGMIKGRSSKEIVVSQDSSNYECLGFNNLIIDSEVFKENTIINKDISDFFSKFSIERENRPTLFNELLPEEVEIKFNFNNNKVSVFKISNLKQNYEKINEVSYSDYTIKLNLTYDKESSKLLANIFYDFKEMPVDNNWNFFMNTLKSKNISFKALKTFDKIIAIEVISYCKDPSNRDVSKRNVFKFDKNYDSLESNINNITNLMNYLDCFYNTIDSTNKVITRQNPFLFEYPASILKLLNENYRISMNKIIFINGGSSSSYFSFCLEYYRNRNSTNYCTKFIKLDEKLNNDLQLINNSNTITLEVPSKTEVKLFSQLFYKDKNNDVVNMNLDEIYSGVTSEQFKFESQYLNKINSEINTDLFTRILLKNNNVYFYFEKYSIPLNQLKNYQLIFTNFHTNQYLSRGMMILKLLNEIKLQGITDAEIADIFKFNKNEQIRDGENIKKVKDFCGEFK